MHEFFNAQLDDEADHESIKSIFDNCLYAPPPLIVSYLSAVLDKTFLALTTCPYVAESAFQLATFVVDLFHRSSFKKHRHLLEKYMMCVFGSSEIYASLISHADTALLWMDYPTINPKKQHCEVYHYNKSISV